MRSNALFIVILTLLISAVVVAVSLLLPQQYSKQVTLDAAAVPTSLLAELDQPPVFDDTQLGNLAVEYLQNVDLEGVSVSPVYNVTTRQVNVALQSDSRDALEAAVPALMRSLEASFQNAYEGPLNNLLDVRVNGLEDEIETNRSAAASLEEEARDLGGTDPRTLARLEGLESARGSALAEIARGEAKIRELEEAREDLPRLADEAVAVEVISETETPQSRSLMPVIALALMLGLTLAVTAAVVRSIFARVK